LRESKRQKIAERLAEFKNLKSISGIRANGKKHLFNAVQNKAGELQTDRQDIMDTFAEFYEDLYTSKGPASNYDDETEVQAAEPFTADEVKEQLRKIAKKKASDSAGMVAELLQAGSSTLAQVIADLFNAVLKPIPEIPDVWRESCVKILFKKGDPKKPDNYRPITLLRILYKLFSRMLHGRIQQILDAAQCADQAGFRAGFGVEDHLFTMVMLVEKLAEFNLPLWVCAVYFRKAFDTVEHAALWKSLEGAGVPPIYVKTLDGLYKHQIGKVVADKTSRPLSIKRGTKQGDPLSPQLFNAAHEHALKGRHAKWRRKGWGIRVASGLSGLLCTLRLADDIMLLAASTRGSFLE